MSSIAAARIFPVVIWSKCIARLALGRPQCIKFHLTPCKWRAVLPAIMA